MLGTLMFETLIDINAHDLAIGNFRLFHFDCVEILSQIILTNLVEFDIPYLNDTFTTATD